MSERIISVMDSHQKVVKSLSKMNTEIRDFFAIYLMLVNDSLTGSEEVVFHNPEHSINMCGGQYHSHEYPYDRRVSGNCEHCVRLTKDKVVREERGYQHNPMSTIDYLVSLGGFKQIPIAAARVAINDIRRFPVDKRITAEMLTEKYDEYKRLQKNERSRERLLKGVFRKS
jgi:hypothetical protein